MRRLVVLLLLLGIGAALSQGSLVARESAAPPPGEGEDPVSGTEAQVGDEELPVEIPEASPEAIRYYRSGNVLWVFAIVWALAVPALVLWTGLAARLRDLAARIAGGRFLLTVVGVFVLYSLVVFVADLPLSFYAGFVRQHEYGLSNQTLGKWIGDALKGLGVGLVGGGLVVWVPYLLIRRFPRRWWLFTGLAVVPFLFVVVLVSPIWIAPLFNDFGPMEDERLEARILGLADRVGVEADRVWEVDKSVDTERVNAYVTGFLETHRIVLWDTLLEKLDDDQVLVVMAHELGHYVLDHIVLGVLLGSAGTFLGLFLVHRASGPVLDRFDRRFGFDHLADPASLPLLILLFNLFAFLGMPVGLAYSRWQEREADRFALELTRDNRAAAEAFVALQTENLSNPRPGPVYRFFRASHPSIAQRIEMCNRYRPWETGEPMRYGEIVRPGGSR